MTSKTPTPLQNQALSAYRKASESHLRPSEQRGVYPCPLCGNLPQIAKERQETTPPAIQHNEIKAMYAAITFGMLAVVAIVLVSIILLSAV